MKERAFWLASIACVSAAICLHMAALSNAGKGQRSFARAFDVNTTGDQKQALMTEAHQYGKASDTLRVAGVGAAVLSVAALIVSYGRKESAIRPMTIVLLAFYLLLQLAVV